MPERVGPGGPPFPSPALDPLDETEVGGKILALEPGVVAAKVVGREIIGARDLPGQEASPEGAVRHQPDAELPGRRHYLRLDVRLHSDHSLCSAVIGCTATARRSVDGLASDSPR